MMNDTDEADDVAAWLREKYAAEFGGEKTQVIHTDKSGEVSKKELDDARKAVHDVDLPESPINAIASVLMLREGWDVKNVTVVFGENVRLRRVRAKPHNVNVLNLGWPASRRTGRRTRRTI